MTTIRANLAAVGASISGERGIAACLSRGIASATKILDFHHPAIWGVVEGEEKPYEAL